MSRRRSLLLVAVIGSLLVGYAAVRMGPPLAGVPTVVQAAPLPGFGSLTGTVQSATPFKAAQVFIRNVDKRVLFMVYTSGGQFRATPLFPGNYEISASANALRSDVQKLVVKAGDNPKVTLSLRMPVASSQRTIVGALEGENSGDRTVTQEASYDEIFPPGPGREIAERTCMICHGENFLATQPATVGTWNLRLDRMQGRNLFDKTAASYAEGLLSFRASALRFSREDRETLVQYLAKNLGPDKPRRAVRVDKEMPLDEAKLGKAEYIEYYLAPDPPGQGINAPEYSKLTGGFTHRRAGQDVRFDQDGNVWLTDRGYPHRLVKLDPRTGIQKDYLLPDPKNGIHEVNIDPSGMIWLAEHSGVQPSNTKRLLAFNPKTEKFEQMIPMDPDNVVRNPIKWLQSIAFSHLM